MKNLIDNWQTVAVILAPIITFLTGWKLKKINEKKEGANALQSIQNVYDILTRQIESEIAGFRKDVNDLKDENREQRADIRQLQKDNSSLHVQVSNLMQENNDLKIKVSALETENAQLRKIRESNPMKITPTTNPKKK